MIYYNYWECFGRKQKLDLLNMAIIELFMADKLVLNGQEKNWISKLDRMRKQEIINNWQKPKYDD